jgi:magnesium chelatase family protein
VLENIARADGAGLALLRDAAGSMRLSARGYHHVLRVAHTLAEALAYRALADGVRCAA